MSSYDVFVSYSPAAAEEIRPLVRRMREAALSVWFEQTGDDFAHIGRSVAVGLANSKTLLAYHTAAYATHRACQWELATATIAAQRERGSAPRLLLVLPERIVDGIAPAHHQEVLLPALSGRPEDLALLAAAVKKRVAGIADGFGRSLPMVLPRWYGHRSVGSARFVGRGARLWQLHAEMASGEPVTLGLQSKAARSGSLGSGTSLLAEEYALRFGAAYPGGIFWLRIAGSSPSERARARDRSLRTLVGELGGDPSSLDVEHLESFIAGAMAAADQPCLWVVDGRFDRSTGRDELRDWSAPHPLARTLFTGSGEDPAIGRRFDLEPLSHNQAFDLLVRRRAPTDVAESSYARAIAELLGDHPLAVDAAGGMVAAAPSDNPYADLLSAISDSRGEWYRELAIALESELPNGHERHIAVALLHAIERLEREGIDQELNPGIDMLHLASVLAPEPIPTDLIAAVFRLAYDLDDAEADRLTETALAELDRRSLAEPGGADLDFRGVHELVSRTMRLYARWYEPERSEQLRQRAVAALGKLFARASDRGTWPVLDRLLSHAHAVAAAGDGEAEAYLLSAVWIFEHGTGAHGAAKRSIETAIDILHRVLPANHPSTLAAMNNLANTLRELGDLAGAREIHEHVLAGRLETLGERHPDTISSLSNLAVARGALGDLLGARELHERTLRIRLELLGERHPSTLASMNNLASTLYDLGALPEAAKMERRTLGICLELFGEEHPRTISSLGNLAITLHDLGDLARARELHERALVLQQQTLGRHHPATLSTQNNLAGTLAAAGDLAGARALHERVVDARIESLGERHPDTLASLNNLAITLHDLGDSTGARTLHERVLTARIESLGERHPDTLASMSNLGIALGDLGDLAAARDLHERTLAARLEMLGENHPSTSISAWNLFATCLELRDQTASRQILQNDLAWLLEHYPDDLAHDQRRIREMLSRYLNEQARR